MSFMSTKLSEFLVKTTRSKDIDDALHKVLSEYFELKLKNLDDTVEVFQKKWGMTFEEFKNRLRDNKLKEDAFSFSTENDFWKWEEAETLKKHYEEIKQWI